MMVWIDGELYDRDEAGLSVGDAGLLHAVGLVETMKARNGVVFRFERHLERAARSAMECNLVTQVAVGPIREGVAAVLEEHGQIEAKVRVLLTGGEINLLENPGERSQHPTIIITVQPAKKYPDRYFEKGVKAMTTGWKLNPHDPMSGYKTMNYWIRIHALQEVKKKKADEVIWCDTDQRLCGGTTSNVFLVQDGVLHTPLAQGDEYPERNRICVVPGITRELVLECAARMGIEVRKRTMTMTDARKAEEVFLTNSGFGVLPVTTLGAKKIGNGAVGEMTRKLRKAWEQAVAEETGSGREGPAPLKLTR